MLTKIALFKNNKKMWLENLVYTNFYFKKKKKKDRISVRFTSGYFLCPWATHACNILTCPRTQAKDTQPWESNEITFPVVPQSLSPWPTTTTYLTIRKLTSGLMNVLQCRCVQLFSVISFYWFLWPLYFL